MNRRSVNVALAGSLAAAITLLAIPAKADGAKEKCYGVALKGQNDCKAGAHNCAGMSTVDYDGASFKLVPAGTCTTMKIPSGMGSMSPSRADRKS